MDLTDRLPVRQVRRCEDHLALVAGAGPLDALLERGWLAPATSPAACALAPAGA